MTTRIKKIEFLELLNELGSHSLYFAAPLSERLLDCGLSVTVLPDDQGLIIEGRSVYLSIPEWGNPGISTLSVLSLVFEMVTGEKPISEMIGRGFWYRDVLTQLAEFWNIDANYL